MELDAVCVGEGDNALPELVARWEQGEPLTGIPNILTPDQSVESMKKELVTNVDAIPFADYDIFFDAIPILRDVKLASVLAGRGCPYYCTYCFNHAYNKLFRSCGPILHKRSVDNIFAEIKQLVAARPNISFLRFADDTFIHKFGEWEEEFFARYKKEIGLPFYCLMRSNTLTDRIGKELKNAGCASIGMALESGNETVRNKVLKRGITDELVRSSFAVANKYGLVTFGNAMFGLPGSTFENDMESVRMMKEIRMTVPTFSFFSPFPGTELTEYGIELGIFKRQETTATEYTVPSKRTDMDEKQLRTYSRFLLLATIFCKLPWFLMPALRPLAKLPLTLFYRLASNTLLLIQMRKLFPGIYPWNPFKLFRLYRASRASMKPEKKRKNSSSA